MANENAATEDSMTFGELLESRRSIRRYQDRPVSVQVVQETIHKSTLAPSAGNEQPWRFVLLNAKEMIKRISDESKKNVLACIAANPEDYANCTIRSFTSSVSISFSGVEGLQANSQSSPSRHSPSSLGTDQCRRIGRRNYTGEYGCPKHSVAKGLFWYG